MPEVGGFNVLHSQSKLVSATDVGVGISVVLAILDRKRVLWEIGRKLLKRDRTTFQ